MGFLITAARKIQRAWRRFTRDREFSNGSAALTSTSAGGSNGGVNIGGVNISTLSSTADPLPQAIDPAANATRCAVCQIAFGSKKVSAHVADTDHKEAMLLLKQVRGIHAELSAARPRLLQLYRNLEQVNAMN